MLSFKSFEKQFLVLAFYHVLVWNRPVAVLEHKLSLFITAMFAPSLQIANFMIPGIYILGIQYQLHLPGESFNIIHQLT